MQRYGPRRENQGYQYNFDPKTGALVYPNENSIKHIDPAWPSYILAETAAQAGFPEDRLEDGALGFDPRIGFAYRLHGTDNTVFRGSYDVFTVQEGYQGNQYAEGPFTSGPFGIDETFINKITDGVPYVTLANPFPSGTGAVGNPGSFNINGINPNWRLPIFQQWSFTIERALPGRWAARLSYVGARQTQLGYEFNMNQPYPSTTPWTLSRDPYPNFDVITYKDSGATSNFGAAQLEFDHRYHNGLLFQGMIQWTKETSDQGGDRGV